jgi:hypothetical protein
MITSGLKLSSLPTENTNLNNPLITSAFSHCHDEVSIRAFINGFNNSRPSGRARRQFLHEVRLRRADITMKDISKVSAHDEPERRIRNEKKQQNQLHGEASRLTTGTYTK